MLARLWQYRGIRGMGVFFKHLVTPLSDGTVPSSLIFPPVVK